MFIVVVLLQCGTGFAQAINWQEDLRFENYNGKNSFVTQFVSNVYRDKKGYVWVCAYGVYRFDGKRHKHYVSVNNTPNNLRNDYTINIVEDSLGRLWMSTGGGLCYYDYKDDGFHYIKLDDKHDITFAFYLQQINNELWFISNYGLCRMDLRTLKVSRTAVQTAPFALGLFVIDSNTLLISNKIDALLYNIHDDTYSPANKLRTISFDCLLRVKGTYWIGYFGGGLYTLNNIDEMPSLVPGTEKMHINSIVKVPKFTGDTILWITTADSGMYVFNINSKKIIGHFIHDDTKPFSIQTNELGGLYADDQGLIWIVTAIGISMLDMQSQALKMRDFPEQYVRAVAEDKYDTGRVWVSLAHHGLIKIDWASQKIISTVPSFNKPYSFFNPDVLDLVQIDSKRWLLCQPGSLLVWNSVTKKVEQSTAKLPLPAGYKNFVTLMHIIPADQDTYYITSSMGLLCYHLHNNTLDPVITGIDTRLNSRYTLKGGAFDGDHTLWLASANGLTQYDIRAKKMTTWLVSNNVDSVVNLLYDVALDDKGNVFCAGLQGLAIFNVASQKMTFHNKFNNFINPRSDGVFVKNGIVWLNSHMGIASYDTKTGKSAVYSSVYYTSYSVELFGKVKDELVVCLRGAYAYFNPDKLIRHFIPSAPLIEQVLVNNRPVLFNKPVLTLKHDENVLNISFTAFYFTDPGHIKFRYKLADIDKEWTYANEERNANYTRLPPGKYSFTVQAGNDGEWNETPATLDIEILPPYWATWWFRTLVLVVLVASVTIVVRLRIRSIKNKEAHKTAVNQMMSELEMKALRSQMNPHFIFNSLNSIQKFIWENKQDDASEYLTKFSRLIRLILDNSMSKLVTLEQELSALSLYLELEHRRSNNKFDYTINIDDKVDANEILVPPLILQPYVENAIWHGLLNKSERGELKVNIIAHGDNEIQCIIEDNGVGRVEAQKIKERSGRKAVSYGMQITEQRLAMMNDKYGKVLVEDLYDTEKAVGTRITVTIPNSNFIRV